MTDTVSREELMKLWDEYHPYIAIRAMSFDHALRKLPSVEPVKHEECEYVIAKGKAGYHEEYKCSVCGDSFYWTHDKMFPNKFNYCRNCGRKIVKFIDESKE